MKAIMLSTQPKWVAKISNGEKKIETRKRFPSDYVGWVYIYCTKGKPYLYRFSIDDRYSLYPYKSEKLAQQYDDFKCFNGKVVARFYCDKVEEIDSVYDMFGDDYYFTETTNQDNLLNKSCLTFIELDKYVEKEKGYAIHISQLEIFDEPKELSEFSIKVFPHRKDNLMTRYLTRAPESYCYIEID